MDIEALEAMMKADYCGQLANLAARKRRRTQRIAELNQIKHEARQYLKAEWMKLYLLPFNDKTPSVRSRMTAITDKMRRYA